MTRTKMPPISNRNSFNNRTYSQAVVAVNSDSGRNSLAGGNNSPLLTQNASQAQVMITQLVDSDMKDEGAASVEMARTPDKH